MDTEQERPPRVLVGMPSGDMIFGLTGLHFAALLAKSREMGIEAQPAMNMGSMPVNNRSALATQAQSGSFDALLLVDQDMIFPPTALLGLMSHGDLDIVGATYAQRCPGGETHGFELSGARLDVSAGGAIREAASIPCGFMLIRRRVLDVIVAHGDQPFFRFPWDTGAPHSKSEDYDFCRRARAAGFRVHVDPELSLAMGHIGITIYTIPRAAGIALRE